MEAEEKIEIKNNEFLRQFEAKINGEKVKLEYSRHPRKIFLTKFVISEDLREKGFDQEFLESVFDQLLEDELRVMPTCSEVKVFFKANKKKYKKLLPTGISM